MTSRPLHTITTSSMPLSSRPHGSAGYRYALLAAACTVFLGLSPQGNATDFFTLQTRSMRLVYYAHQHEYIVPHLARSFENALSFHKRLFGYLPSEDVLVFLQDYDDYGYAGATGIPRNYMILGIEPYEYTYETSPTNERFNWVTTHELTHIVATDMAAPADRFYRSLFQGKVLPVSEDPLSMLYSYLTTPRKYSPRWYHEGIAVFMETWMSGGIGRAINGFDEMTFRTMVRDSNFFYDFVGLESEGTTIDFQIGANSYLYGTRFVSYLGKEYGPAKVIEWFARSDTSDAYFASHFERVFGRDLDDEWSRWIRFEREWQHANLDSLRRYPPTQTRAVCASPLGAVSQAHLDADAKTLIVGVNAPGETAHFIGLDISTGETRTLADLPSPSLYTVASTAYDERRHTLFFTTKNSRGWRDLNTLDVQTGEAHVLLKNARIGDLAFNRTDASLWGVQHHDGVSRIVRIPRPYEGWQDIVPLKYGVDLYDPDISPDGKTLVASMTEISGRHQLIALSIDSLLGGHIDYDVLYEFANTAPLNFVFSPDGRYLYGSTFHTGVSNIVRYDRERKQMEWLTNAETGLFRPVPVSPDSFLAFQFSTSGFQPVMIGVQPREDLNAITYLGQSVVESHPEVKAWKLPPPSPVHINIDSLQIASGDYNGLAHLGLGSLYPVLHGYKNTVAAGLRMNIFDPLLLHNADISVSYSPHRALPVRERLHILFNYNYWQWKLRASYNAADFYDLFGPTKRSRKGNTVSLTYADMLVDDRPTVVDFSLGAAYYWELERLPYAQNIEVTYDRFFTLNGQLGYTRTMRSLGAVDAEKGTRLSLNAYTFVVRSVWFPQFQATADLGFALPWHHASVWLRTAAGYSPKDEEEPFSNFYFGGFGNNWVDFREVRRYHDAESFPGFPLNEVSGTTFLKGMVEWTLPPLRFRRLGFSALYCTWARLALFTGALSANLHATELRREVATAGAQVDFKLVIFSNLSSTLSLGYAFGLEKDQRTAREFMISLKIL